MWKNFIAWKIRSNKKKKIKSLQEIIDHLKKWVERNIEQEKHFLDQAARELESASLNEGKYKSVHLQRKESSVQNAKYFADSRAPVLQTLAVLESFKKAEIEALLPNRALTNHQKAMDSTDDIFFRAMKMSHRALKGYF